MKRSLMLAAVILIVGTIPVIYQHQRAAGVRVERDTLRTEAAKLGIPLEADSGAAAGRAKRQRDEMERRSVGIAAELASVAREIDELGKTNDKPGDELHRRAVEAMSRLMELDSAQIRKVIAELRGDPGISDETRGNLIAFSILSLSADHPQAAIALFTETSDMLGESLLGDHVVSSALSHWAETDPVAAMDWIRSHAVTHPDLVDDDARQSVLAGAAVRDPALAFKLMGELQFEDPMSAIQSVMMAGSGDPEKRTAVYNALREHLKGIEDPVEREETSAKALEILARTIESGDFDSLTGWVGSAKLSESEKAQFAGGLTWFTTKGDTGRWVEWISGNVPGDRLAEPVRELVGEWTQQDYVAAGEWLSRTPEGPAKTAAVEAYAGAVAEYEPQVAAQWALSLPEGPAREATLRTVHENWPASDPEGAAAFAREHKLE